MSEEEATKLVQEIFASSPFIKAWRVRSEACREEQQRQADLLREAVEATCYRTLVLFFKGNDEKTVESELAAWKAYKESL